MAQGGLVLIHFHRFDSSRSPGRGPLNVQIGVGQVIKGNFSFLYFAGAEQCWSSSADVTHIASNDVSSLSY